MNALLLLIAAALGLGFAGLWAFIWSMKSGQYDDMDGAPARALLDEDPES